MAQRDLFITIEGLPSKEKKTLWKDLDYFKVTKKVEDLHLIPGKHRLLFPRSILHQSDTLSELLGDTLLRRDQILSDINSLLKRGWCVVICLDWLACTYAHIHYYLNNANPLGKTYPWGDTDASPVSVDVPSLIFNLHNLYCQRLYPDISFFVDVPPTLSPEYATDEEFTTSSEVIKEEFSYEYNRSIGEIPGLGDDLDFALERLYKGYLDFGRLCSPYIDKLRTPHHMGKTEWVPIRVSREKPVLLDQILERIGLEGE